jgi:hypothetical protein
MNETLRLCVNSFQTVKMYMREKFLYLSGFSVTLTSRTYIPHALSHIFIVSQVQQHKASLYHVSQMGKEKAMPQILGCSADSDSNTVQQFELELQWCIQQLEAALATSKMAPKQGTCLHKS